MTFKKPNLLLLFILITGALLRFYGFPNIPFMYDEVSAWARTGFNSFHELIEKGVKGDGHPAGVQVFLNYWRMIFGDSEASFKLPFLIMGLLCIWLVYRIGKFWFNETVGYIAAAFVSALQYIVMYSQIARPYVSGLFFSLMMVWCWTNYFFKSSSKNCPIPLLGRGIKGEDNRQNSIFRIAPNPEEKRKRWHLTGFVLFAALCCYDHYFSLLFAFIVGITGLFLLKKENLTEYIIAGIIILLLFIPHLPITFYHFGIGGVGGWLAKPTPQFFSDYLNYIFQFSSLVKILVIALILLSIIFYNREIREKQKFRLIALAWFLVPMLIGYYYSVNRNAVLQYSVLIFSFPYLLMFLFSLFKELKPVYNFLMVAAVMIVCSYSLIFERDHYDLFYRQPIEELVKNSIRTTQQLKGGSCTVMMNEPKKYAGYYLEKYHSNLSMDYWAAKNFQTYIEFRNYLSSLSTDYFIAGKVPSDYLLLVKEFYPYKIESEKGFTYSFYCFSKKKGDQTVIDDRVFVDSLHLKQPGDHWRLDKNSIRIDSSSGSLSYRMDSSQEYGPTFSTLLQPLVTNGYNILNVSMRVSGVRPGNKSSLVVSFEEKGKSMFWQEKPFSLFMDSTEASGLVFYSISLRDIGVSISDQLSLNVYVWNKSKDAFNIDEMKIDLESGNPWIYGLIEKIPCGRMNESEK